MDNIRVKKESLYDWRSILTEETECDCEGCGQDPCIKCGESHHNINEEIQGGVSVENYADGVQFNEIETVDIIKPKALDPSDWRSDLSDWRSDLEVVDEGVGKIASKVIKSPSVKKFVGNLSKRSPVKVLGRSGTPKRAAYNPNLTLKPHEAPGAARDIVTKSQGATMKGGVKSTTWKSHSSMNRGSQGNAVKVYQQPTYAKPNKYPGDKTGAYARELARQDNTARIGIRSKIGKDGTTVDPYWPGTNTVGGKTKLKPARGLEDKNLEFLKKFKESYSWRNELGFDEGNRTRFKGYSLSGSGNKKDMSKGPNEKALIDYTKIQAKADKKKEVVAASNEIEGDLVDEGLLSGALSGAKLIAKVTPKVTKAVFKGGQALARKGAGDIAKFKKTRELIRRVNNIADIRATKSLEPIKPAKIKWNATVPPKSKPSVTTSTTKALPGFAKIDPPKIKWNATVPPKSKSSVTKSTKALPGFAKIDPPKIKWNATVPSKIKPKVSTFSTKQITGSAGTQYRKPIGANPTAKTQYKEPIGANPTAKTQYKEPIGANPIEKTQYDSPITPNYSRSQRSALTGKANKIIDQIRGKTPGAKVNARMTKAIDSSTKKGTYSDKINQLLKLPDPEVKSPISTPTPTPTKKSIPTPKKDEGGKAIKRVIGGVVSATGYNLVTGGKKKKEVKEGVASVVAKTIPWGKVATKVGGAVLAAKGGEKILKDLLGTPDQPKKTDWDKNPKDKIDQELNVKQGQAKDAAKNKSFDDEMKAYRKAKEAGNLSSDQRKDILSKNAKLKKSIKTKKESFSNWKSEINLQ